MAKYQLLLPKMGESITEATIIKWLKQPGEIIKLDDAILEIATDKIDSEIPSPVEGKLLKQLVSENEVTQVGSAIAVIELEYQTSDILSENEDPISVFKPVAAPNYLTETPGHAVLMEKEESKTDEKKSSDHFYSPLVKSIAAQEDVSLSELDSLNGSGLDGRVTKDDLLNYIQSRPNQHAASVNLKQETAEQACQKPKKHTTTFNCSNNEEIIEMDRMRKLIAEHMVMSKQTSPHVTSFVEADVTNLVCWRNKIKKSFEQREKEKITFTSIFIEAITKAIRDFPMINVSVKGSQIIKKRDINIGMATALPNGNLIVPVIKNADQLSLIGLTKAVNDLANRARNAKLNPDETQNGTFTLTNIGSFKNIMGTPIINQPQVAILAVGVIKKKPAVLETEYGDVIAVRHQMFLSLSYDHRVINGALGGMFVCRVADYLENWNINREIV